MTFSQYANIDVDVDIYEVFDELSLKEQKEFLNEKFRDVMGGTETMWQNFVYELADADTEQIIKWLKFYNKI